MNTKTKKIILITSVCLIAFSIAYAMKLFSFENNNVTHQASMPVHCAPEEPACVMKTLFGLESKPLAVAHIKTKEIPAEANAAILKGLDWMAKAQAADGGWGAGTSANQHVKDPHKVVADPATTALVSMSLLRTGHTLTDGKYSAQIKKATEFLLKEVEQWEDKQPYLTTLTGTQPQNKLGQNIDAILTVQYFTNLLKQHQQHDLESRIKKALDKCVMRIQKEQDTDGGWKGGTWAPVLQSALAGNALEEAKDVGANVDSAVLVRSKKYQNSNYDVKTKSAVTGASAGIMLYSLSSTTRSSAADARKAIDILDKAKGQGTIKPDAEVNEENLRQSGIDAVQAKELATAYNINQGSQQQAIQEDVMDGFGNNGGEEFLSYLMTGESILMQGGNQWKQWYDMMSKKIISIQNGDGSWQGHHCITSPVFCTATCLLILSIQNDFKIEIPKKS